MQKDLHRLRMIYTATAWPTLWNSLPEQLQQPDIIFGQFKQSLKTFVFGWLDCGAPSLNVKGAD